MIHRPRSEGILAISQPMHAWLSGLMARAWGNAAFSRPEPWNEVCLAAEQHDLAWTEWERRPKRNAATGYPHTVFDLPDDDHAAVWTGTGRRALIYGRYAALLASLHGTGFYENTDPATLPPVRRRYLEQELAFQREMIASLARDPATAPWVTLERIRRNRRLIATLDYISLILVMNSKGRTLADVPGAEGAMTSLALHATDESGLRWRLSPWPFSVDTLELTFEGRALTHPSATDAEMDEALEAAGWARVSVTLEKPTEA